MFFFLNLFIFKAVAAAATSAAQGAAKIDKTETTHFYTIRFLLTSFKLDHW